MADLRGTARGRSKPRVATTTDPGGVDPTKFIHPAQVGGIEAYAIDDGPGRGVRALCVNTGGGLRYRVLVDRGLDIDQAFFHQHSLAFLTHKGPSAPAGGLERGIDWLKTFPGGLLTSCGPFNIGPPGTDAGEDLPLHGPHSNTPAAVEAVVQPDPHAGRGRMEIVGALRYGRLFGPNLTLRRTIASDLGGNRIDVTDEFHNAGNLPVPHAWLLHINFGYPLVDAGAEFCYDAKVVPLDNPLARERFHDDCPLKGGGTTDAGDNPGARERFRKGESYKKVPPPLDAHRGSAEAVAYLFPRAGRDGRTSVGLVNRRLGIGVAVRYNTKEFPRCVNWQHWGPGEYVTALEPANGTVGGRWADREQGLLDSLEPGGRKTYRYAIEVVTGREAIEELRALNAAGERR